MKPCKVICKNGEGREVNPNPQRQEDVLGGYVDVTWINFEQSVKVYTAPGIPDGEHDCVLVRQFKWNTLTPNWNDGDQADGSGYPTRTIWVLASPEIEQKEITDEEKLKKLLTGVEVVQTNLALGHAEWAYFVHYRDRDYLCIGLNVRDSDQTNFVVGKLYRFAKHEIQHLDPSNFNIEYSTLWNGDFIAWVLRKLI